MDNDLYIQRFTEALADVHVMPSLQDELENIRKPGDPAMNTDEFRRKLLTTFTTILEDEQEKNPEIEYTIVAIKTINTFAKQFAPERGANKDSILSMDAQEHLRYIFDGIMARVIGARFTDPQAQILPFKKERR